MKHLIYILLVTIYAQAGEIHRFKLNDDQKLISTFSGRLNKLSSLHFAVAKNKTSGHYDILTFYTDSKGSFKQLDNINFKKEPKIVSWHINGDKVTIINHNFEKITLVDFDLITGKAVYGTTTDVEKPDNIFAEEGKTLYVYYKGEKDGIRINEYIDASTVSSKLYPIDKQNIGTYKEILNTIPEEIESNGALTNGSIVASRSYINGDFLIITNDDSAKGNTSAIILNTVTGSVISKAFKNNVQKQKDLTTFITDGNLFSSALSRDDMVLKIYDLSTGDETKTYSLKNDFSKHLYGKKHENVFLNEGCKNAMKPIVAVRFDNEQYIVRMDVTEKKKYTNYYNNWWFHHWWFVDFYQQQQYLMRMGPDPGSYELIDNCYSAEKTAITMVLDKRLQLVGSSNVIEGYKDVNKGSYINRYREIKYIQNFTAVFLEKELRYIYQHKDTGIIYISSVEYM